MFVWMRKDKAMLGNLSIQSWHGIFITFIESSLMGIIYFLTLYFVNILHLTILQATSVISFFGIGTIFGGFIAGKLCDYYTSSIVRVSTLLLQSIIFFTLYFIQNFYHLLFIMVLMGVASYGFITSNYLWVLKNCQNNHTERLKTIALLDVGSNLGLSFSGLIISFLPTAYFKILFLFVSSIFFILTLFCSYNAKDNNFQVTLQSNQPADKTFLRKSFIIYTLTSLFLVGIMISQMNSNLPLYLNYYIKDIGQRIFGILIILNSFFVVILQAPIVFFLSHYNKLKIIGIGGFLFGLGMFLLIFAKSIGLAIISCLIYTFGEIFFFSVAQSICYEKASENEKGFYVGLYRTVYASSRVVGPILGGVLLAKSPILLWYTCGLLGIVTLLPSLYLSRFT